MPPLKALGPSYVLCPALLGAVIFVFLAAVINNASSRSYPSSIYPLPEPPEPKALMGELKKEIQNAFNVFDADGSGEIDSMELTLTMRALGLNPTPAEVREIMAEVDDDGSGTMEFEEFANLMQKMILAPSTHKDDILYSAGGEMNLNKLQLCAKAMRDPSLNPEEMESLEAQLQEEIVEAFNMFDEDGSGEIDEEEMENSMKALGLKPTNEEVKRIIAETDKTGSGTINLEEFGKLMRDLIVNPKTHKDDILNSSGSDEFDLKNLQRITTELRATLTEKELQEGKMEEDALSPMAEYLKKFKGKGAPPMPRPPIKQTLFSWLGSFSGIASLGLLQKYVLAPLPTGDVVLLVGSFGAMSVLLYSMPAAPFSQPKNALLGNTIGGAVGVAVVKAFELCHLGHMLWLMAALAVSLTIVAQERTTSVHPPGGATALIFVMKSCVAGLPPSHSFGVSDVWDWFIFCPGFLGTAILVFVALTINNISEKRNYPARWWS
jgi:Ca2+-binding EF-hand superfamily protein